MKNIAVVGLGKVGSLVATLLSDLFTVTGIDQRKPQDELPFEIITGSVSDSIFIEQALKDKDAVVSCLPYNLNLPVANAAFKLGIHYFDLTEDVPTTSAIRIMAETSKGVMAPQCGLAPGFIGIVGANLYNRFTRLRDVELRVGALPKYPNGLLGYSFTWSPAGVINEYINDAEVIHNGTRKMVPAERRSQYDASMELYHMNEKLAALADTINKTQKLLADNKYKLQNEKSKKLVDDYNNKLEELRATLMATKQTSLFADEKRLKEDMNELYRSLVFSEAAPSNLQLQSIESFKQDISKSEEKGKEIIKQYDKAVMDAFKKENIDTSKPKGVSSNAGAGGG